MQRDVAQFGSAPGLGPGGRRFESCHPDHEIKIGMGANLSYFFIQATVGCESSSSD